MRVSKEPSFVIRTTPFSESSLIVDVFSRKYGRLNLLAKGARRKKSRFRGNLQKFCLLQMSWAGRGKVPTIRNLLLNNNFDISGNYFYSACYLNELLIKLLHNHDPHPKLFDAYQRSLERLVNSADEFGTLRIFEKKILKELGYALILDTEANRIDPISNKKFYFYDFNSGPVPTQDSNEGSISGATLQALAIEEFHSNRVRLESRKLLDNAIRTYFNHKVLHCRDVYQQTLRTR